MSDLSDLSDLSDKKGASRYTPWVCLPQCSVDRAKRDRRGMRGNLMAAGVCVLRGRGTIKTDEYGNERKRTEKWVCRGILRGFAEAQCGVDRAKRDRRGMHGSLMAAGVCVLRGRDA